MQNQDLNDDLLFCRWALDGEVSIVDAAKALFDNHNQPEDPWNVGIPEVTTLYNLITELDLAGIPLGYSRQYWNRQTLEKQDRLKPQIEEKYQAEALLAFQAIIDEYTRVGLPRGYHAWPRSAPQE